ncbi:MULTISPECIES: GGDEF domain-containing protein [Paenibacillus]|uniref:GGDEF domain-containing protein n=1 Tax=Paenibacillus TaxID=44249 RepID=UPI001F405BD3|nr:MULTISPECIES: GGDEF domain-containing protein [Paenibacillus]
MQMWVNFGLFLVLLGTFVYIFASSVITGLHKMYLSVHSFMMLWPLFQFAMRQTDDPQFQLLYLTAAFVGIALLGAFWYIFTICLVGESYLLKTRNLIVIFLPAAITAAGLICNPNELFFQYIGHDTGDADVSFWYRPGPLLIYMPVLLAGYFAVSIYAMVSTLRRDASPRHRRLVVTALYGMLLLTGFGLADFAAAMFFHQAQSVLSAGLALAGIYYALAVTRYSAFDIINIAQRDVIDTMSTGLLVLDEHNVVIEMNKALRSILPVNIGDKFDLRALSSLSSSSRTQMEAFFSMLRKHAMATASVEIATAGSRHYELHSTPILNHRNTLIGRVITFQDVTEYRRLMEEMNDQNAVLQERNRELILMQDQLFQANQKLERMAVTDALTGCFNRRYLLQQLEREVVTNVRYRIPFAMFLFDIDLFKMINDSYGHLVGDEVLRSTADIVRRTIRRTDILARYGGEEFAVYLPYTTSAQAVRLAERVKAAVEHNAVGAGGEDQLVSVTISMGVLCIRSAEDARPGVALDDAKDFLLGLFAQADAALYEAKNKGRNCIVVKDIA